MRKATVLCLLVLVSICVYPNISFALLSPPYDTAPSDTDQLGNSARANGPGFLVDPGAGYYNLIYYIGTNTIPGSLILDFAMPFTDASGHDFAIKTGDYWGTFANDALFEFYMGASLVDSFSTSLSASQLFEFEFPGSGLIANQIVITNITPDPPGINNDGTMSFIDAGVAHTVPEPATMFLITTGLIGMFGLKRKES